MSPSHVVRNVAMVLLLACFALWDSANAAQPPVGENDGENNVRLGPAAVWNIHLEISPEQFDAMQPPPPAGPGAFGPGPFAPPPSAPTPNQAGANQPESERNAFGTEFRWAKGDFTAEGETLKNVGIRYAGDITYLVSAAGLKRPMKIEFDKFTEQSFANLSAIQLHSMPLDPSKAREVLASSLFRACGVPTPRTAFAEVTLTVSGRLDKELLGLYTVVEDVDAQFFQNHFGSSDGLALRPFRLRGVDFLGDNWGPYLATFQPLREAGREEQQRVIEFARLINLASDEDFEEGISSFIDVDAFLRFMAANALTANLESFLALGHNYTLYLDPETRKFHFIPGDLEFSLANLLLMGSPEQLMDLSVRKPYPGENKLPDRLLAIDEVAQRYRKLLQELTSTAFTKDRIVSAAARIDEATSQIRTKEQQAAAARPGPAAPFGPPIGMGPQAPDLQTFAAKRVASVAAQLDGTSDGYVPQPFSFGPPPGAGGAGGSGSRNVQPMDDALFRESVHVPAGFEATLFAAPPQVSYPVAIACEPDGALYVAVDEQGSLGRTPGGGRILRCIDSNDDGQVDEVTVFARVEHPRGVAYRDGKVWVMHPPTLSMFRDEDGDGVADTEEVLVTGLTTNQITERGGDHTTNCVRMGIDGWLYIGVGDYGIQEAQGKDGRTVVMRGGGIVRVRPDGTELEVFCMGLRNPFDLAIDPFLNIFTRDNTNDGAGWDTRISLLKQSALYGYTQLFANFTDEIMPTLGTFGNGGGTGGLFVQDSRWPAPFHHALLTGDWGRSEVYRHDLTENGPAFDIDEEVFVQIPRATGMDLDGLGRLYVASWRGGEASVFSGPNIGFVARITPKGLEAEPFPKLRDTTLPDLIQYLAAPEAVTRLHAQGEILARGRQAESTERLIALASSADVSLESRVAAIFTLKQLDGGDSHVPLVQLAGSPEIREFALRALTDRDSELEGLSPELFVRALEDESPRVRAQATISLARVQNPAVADRLLPLTMREKGSEMPTSRPLQNQPDPGRVIPHLAVRALVALNAVDTCLEGLDGPHADGALWVMRYLHSRAAVEGLIHRLRTANAPELRRGVLVTLIRLHYREADYDGSWWGIRPDSSGPYYDRAEWEMTERIGQVLTTAISDSDVETAEYLKGQLARHGVALPAFANRAAPAQIDDEKPIVLPEVDPDNPDQIGNLTYEAASSRALSATGDAKKGEALFPAQSCSACHTTADGQIPKGPHLHEIGKRYNSLELVESILKPSAKLAQGYETYQFIMEDGRILQGFVVSERANVTVIREADGRQHELLKGEVEERRMLPTSAMPDGLVANLTSEQLADLIAYLQSLK